MSRPGVATGDFVDAGPQAGDVADRRWCRRRGQKLQADGPANGLGDRRGPARPVRNAQIGNHGIGASYYLLGHLPATNHICVKASRKQSLRPGFKPGARGFSAPILLG